MTEFVPEQQYMERALELAALAASMGEVPVGAVVVHKPTGRIVGEGYNRRETDRSPLAHAEIMAIQEASRTLGGWRLVDSALYVTLEPCPMCAGAILHARLDQVVFGTRDPKGGAVYSVQEMFALPYNWKPEVLEGLMQEECAQVLRDFFRELRMKKREKRSELHETL
ncbi:MAG: tRNA adenosine(34) deaminase TadA [Ruminococcus sp.]